MQRTLLRRMGILAALAAMCGWDGPLARGDDASAIEQRLLDDVKTLASDEYEGRGVGTAGLDKAAEYVASAFRAAGLDVSVAGGDPFQEFEVTTGAELTSPNVLTLTNTDGTPIELQFDRDFRTCSFGDAGSFAAGIVFCGYGIDANDPPYNDFENVDVKGKVVLLMRRNPQQAQENGLFAVAHGVSRHAALTTKVSEAFQRGAAAVLIVNDPSTGRNEREQLEKERDLAETAVVVAAETVADAGDESTSDALQELRVAVEHLRSVRELLKNANPDPLIAFGYGGSRSGQSPPVMQITQEACNRLLEPALGKTLEQIEAEIDATGKPLSAVLTGWTADGQASLRPVRVPIKNVIGVLEGHGPLSDETVVVGAHYDHVGLGGEGSLAPGSREVHNGADDNASGAAALMELARRLAARPEKLPRRVVFIAFTGEERGLLGSVHYVNNPLYPLEKTVAMLNMDMVGRLQGDRLTVFGTDTSAMWNPWLDEAAAHRHFQLAKQPEGLGPSDHASFYTKRIPVLHLFTGAHGDYHRPTDDWEKINVPGLAQVVDFIEELTIDVATSPGRPDFVEVAGRASLDRGGSRPYFGSIPDFSSDAAGYAIQGVAPGSPAEAAGLQGGDVIVRLGGHAIGGLDDFDLALRKFTAGQKVEVVVLRKDSEFTLHATLATPRS